MIPLILEELIWEGKAEFKTQSFGLAQQFILTIQPKTFVIITGFAFSPRAYPKNKINQPEDPSYLLQQIILSDVRKSSVFVYKPFMTTVADQQDDIFFSEVIQELNLYLVFDSDISIFIFNTTLQNIVVNSDTLPTAGLLRPNITAGGTQAVTNIDEILPGVNYAPLQEYGETIGIQKSDEKSLVLTQQVIPPVESDPSDHPYLTITYVVCKFQKPQELQ